MVSHNRPHEPKVLTPDLVRDFAEEKVLGSKSKIDDALVLPICKMVRTAFDIPDDD